MSDRPKKETGSFILECYSKWGEKKKAFICGGYMDGIKKAKKWESKSGRTAILSRVLYNTLDNNKWGYIS